jgi:hypothetical protein
VIESSSPIAVHIQINGTIYTTSRSTVVGQNEISHSLVVYLTLWGKGDLEDMVERCGFSAPNVTAVHVDGSLVNFLATEEEEEVDAMESNDAASSTLTTATAHRHLVLVALGLILFQPNFF